MWPMNLPLPTPTAPRIWELVFQVRSLNGLSPIAEAISDEAPLYGAQGIGLDSLDMAVLSSLLEKEFGNDPFSHGVFARSVREIVQFYESTTS